MGINDLTPEERKKFENIFDDVINSETWCRGHGINRSNPDQPLAKQILYDEIYSQLPYRRKMEELKIPPKREDKTDWTKYRKNKN